MIIEILPNPSKDAGFIYTKEVISFLSKYDCKIIIPKNIGIPESDCIHYSTEELKPDIIIILGGDGSIMRASHRAALLGIPLLGINLGRIGYLAELEPHDINLLSAIFENDYTVEKRMMIEVQHIRSGISQAVFFALNDAVVSHGTAPKIIESEIFCDGSSLGKYRSDGFIISTPTGSTAYSLSAGGPIIDPLLSGICLIAICPHSLTARPIIVKDSSVIEFRYIESDDCFAYLTVDGGTPLQLVPGDVIKITCSKLTADFIRIKHSSNFYKILRDKMSES